MKQATTLPAPGAQAPLLPPGKLELKYLFGALMDDGTTLMQTHEDKSQTVEGRTAYFDLLQLDADGNQVIHPKTGSNFCRSDVSIFLLEGDGHRYVVDLADGHFEVQYMKGRKLMGGAFFIKFPPTNSRLRPFYFRRRRNHTNVSGTVQEDGSVGDTSSEEVSQECEYHFGWETEDGIHRAEMVLV